MQYCTVLGCCNDTRYGNIDSSVTFHTFPGDPSIRQKWILATGRQYWKPRRTAKVCSAHFKSDQIYIAQDNQRYLREGALPTLKVFAYDHETEEEKDYEEPSTSTCTENETKEVDQDDDDDDIICIESTLGNRTKINNATIKNKTPRAGFVEDVTALKGSKSKIPLGSKKVVNIEITNDEFQMFANNIAAQLRTVPLDIALNLQTKIYELVVKERIELYRMSKKKEIDVLSNVGTNE